MKIENIKVKRILDSRGEETIEVEILSEGLKERASVPIGKSLGKHEAICLDCEKIEKNLPEFLKNIKNSDFKDSKDFDNFLIEGAGKNKEKLGANFTLGASIAFARVLAKKEGLELWEYLEREYLPELNDRISYPNYRPDKLPESSDRIKSTRITRPNNIYPNEKLNNDIYPNDNRIKRFGPDSGKAFGQHSGNENIFGQDSGRDIIFGPHSGKFPGLILNIIGGGVHSKNNLDFQEYWLITDKCGFETDLCGYFDGLLAKILNVINKLEKKLPKPLGRNDEGAFCTNFSDNYEPFVYLKEFKDDFQLGADIAANQITKLVNWKRIYEKLKLLDVKYLEDPFKEDEFENFANLRKQGFKVIGDDLTVTNVERLKIALEKNSVDGVIVKPNQVGTILETFEFVKLAKENNLFTIFSHRSGETNDHWLIDLGIAFKADFFKIGPPLQGERVAKYNRLREILERF
jgi:enolase